MINVRLREAEANAELIELRQRVSGLDIKNQELITNNSLIQAESNHRVEELKDRIMELKREVAVFKKRERLRSGEKAADIEREIEQDPELLQREQRVLEDEANQEEVMGIDISIIESDNDEDIIAEISDEEVLPKDEPPHSPLERKESTV
ncbi:uncharacterized protein LOC129277965 [Lytechinus pictus]|uniref:uncharacterized protein LOC129277965 n=1 Tax=Lytechinus pictus TaxID=7653 RepID=UPI0030B9C4FB